MIYKRKSKMNQIKVYRSTEAQRRATNKYRNNPDNKALIYEYDKAYKTILYNTCEEYREIKKAKAREYYYKKKAEKAMAQAQ